MKSDLKFEKQVGPMPWAKVISVGLGVFKEKCNSIETFNSYLEEFKSVALEAYCKALVKLDKGKTEDEQYWYCYDYIYGGCKNYYNRYFAKQVLSYEPINAVKTEEGNDIERLEEVLDNEIFKSKAKKYLKRLSPRLKKTLELKMKGLGGKEAAIEMGLGNPQSFNVYFSQLKEQLQLDCKERIF